MLDVGPGGVHGGSHDWRASGSPDEGSGRRPRNQEATGSIARLRALERAGESAALASVTGAIVQESAVLRERLAKSDQGAHLRREIEHFARYLVSLAQLRDLKGEPRAGEHLAQQEVTVEDERMRLLGSWLGAPSDTGGPAVLVILERTGDSPLEIASLRARFGLSPREARIARLLALGLSNDEISDVVYLSPFTVRNHTQRVLRRLGLRSRSRIAPVLLGLSEPD